jgi:hypothetical protein
VRALLTGPSRPARLLAAFPTALYLETAADGPPEVLAVLTRDALRLPFGVVLAATSDRRPFPAVPAGTPAALGASAVEVPALGLQVTVRRWWRPAALPTGAPGTARGARAALLAGLLPPLPPELTGPVAALERWLAGPGAPAGPVVRRLLGLGPGLTPAGDDVLAGLLVGLSPYGEQSPTAAALRAEVLAQAPARTTTLSGALLRHAAAGAALPEVAAVGRSLAGRSGDVRPALRRLLAVGHSSGAALGHGLLLAARYAPGTPGARTTPDREVA